MWLHGRRKQSADLGQPASGVPEGGSVGAPHHPCHHAELQRSLDVPDLSRLALRINSTGRTSKTCGAAPIIKKTMSTTILRGGTAHHACACWRGTYGPAADRQRPSAPRPRPPAWQRQHRHGSNTANGCFHVTFAPRSRGCATRGSWSCECDPATHECVCECRCHVGFKPPFCAKALHTSHQDSCPKSLSLFS